MCEEQEKIEITNQQWKEYNKLKDDIKILKRKLARSKPELVEWIEMHFGELERD